MIEQSMIDSLSELDQYINNLTQNTTTPSDDIRTVQDSRSAIDRMILQYRQRVEQNQTSFTTQIQQEINSIRTQIERLQRPNK